MKSYVPLIFTVILFSGLGISLYLINDFEKSSAPETWSAFIYTNGFNSGQYHKQDDFASLQQCRDYANSDAANPNGENWECGLNCTFDSSRQGFQCATMANK